jgi:hypothetical protein
MPAFDYSTHVTNPIAQGSGRAVAKAQESSFSFGDLLDIVNPLQHIPVISTLYRHLTGDKIGTPEKIAGDTLFGGLTGLLCSVGDSIFEELTGKSVGDTVYAMVVGDDDKTTAVASDTSSMTPVSVTPASSLNIALPDFSFLNDADDDEPAATPSLVVAQRAMAAYRAAGRTVEAY